MSGSDNEGGAGCERGGGGAVESFVMSLMRASKKERKKSRNLLQRSNIAGRRI